MWRFLLVAICITVVGCSSQPAQKTANSEHEVIPSNTALYLRGDMTNWEARTEYRFQQVSLHLFSIKTNLTEAGKTYHFKFADAQWMPSTNYGAAIDDAVLSLDSPMPLRAYSCLDELTFTPEQSGEYEFILDFRGRKPLAVVKLANNDV